jgi:YesN/AraC family two-component response regulator
MDQLFCGDIGLSLKNDPDDDLPFLSSGYFANMVNNRQSLFHHTPFFLEQELLSKIKAGNLNDSIAVLNEINSLKKPKLAKEKTRSIKNSLICSVTLFTRAAIDGGVPPEAAFTLSDSAIMEIERMDDIYRLMDYEYKTVRQYVRIVQELSKNKYSNIIQQALSYIYRNLASRLTLGDISDAVFVHPNYLSTLFIKEVGMNLPDYIMKTRIEESKYYIRYTNTRISDIASFYQFCNQSYFTQAFKKYAGLTPRKYREKYNNQNE